MIYLVSECLPLFETILYIILVVLSTIMTSMPTLWFLLQFSLQALTENAEQAILSKELASISISDILCFYLYTLFSLFLILSFYPLNWNLHLYKCLKLWQALLRCDLPSYMVPFTVKDLLFTKPEVCGSQGSLNFQFIFFN